MDVKQKKLEKSQIELTFELTAEEFEHHIDHALSHMKSHVKIDGFRPGQAPNKLVEEKIKPESLLMEAGDCAVRETYIKYVKDNNLEPIGQPDVKIVKIVPTAELSRIRDSVKNGVGTKEPVFIFTATITVLPDVELPDYKEIAKKISAQGGPASGGKGVEVSENEIQDALNYLQKTRAKMTLKDAPAQKGDFVEVDYQNKDISGGQYVHDHFVLGEGGFMKGFEESIVGMKAGEEKEFKVPIPKESRILDKIGTTFHEGMEMDFKVKLKSVQKMELPEINDEFAKQLGAFDTLVALKQSMKEGITTEKIEQEKQRKRGEILEKIGEKSRVELPEAMVDYEKQRLLEDLKERITQTFSAQGGPASGWEQYLSAVKQTEEALTQTFQKEAEKRLKGFLVLRELGKKENIEVSDEEVAEEVEKSTKNYPKEDLAKIDIEQLKEYTKGVLYNEKVFKILESFLV